MNQKLNGILNEDLGTLLFDGNSVKSFKNTLNIQNLEKKIADSEKDKQIEDSEQAVSDFS